MSQVAKVTHLSTPPGPAPAPPPTEPAKVGVALKVYAKCLAPDIEYKTVIVTRQMSSRELILVLLSKCRMKHRDPKLFYLTMDVTVKKTGKLIFTEKPLSPCIINDKAYIQVFRSRGRWCWRTRRGRPSCGPATPGASASSASR